MPKVRVQLKSKRPTFLREWRKAKGMTLERVAEVLDVTPGALSQIERGQIQYTQGTLEGLAFVYGCEPGDLLIRNPTDPEAPWSIWEALKPAQRKQALRILKAMAGEEDDEIAA